MSSVREEAPEAHAEDALALEVVHVGPACADECGAGVDALGDTDAANDHMPAAPAGPPRSVAMPPR